MIALRYSFTMEFSLKIAYQTALSLVLLALLSGMRAEATAVFYVNSIGSTANNNIYGTTLDVAGNVTDWGAHYKDVSFKLVAASSSTSLTSSAVWVSANKGNNADSTGNLLRATWFAGPIVSNPTYSSRLGTASLNSTLLTSSFADFMIGPSSFDVPVAISTSGSDFFIRIWAIGSNSNEGFGIKLADNTSLEYASPDSPITMYNWNGTSYNSSPATVNIALVPEPSAFSLLFGGLGLIALLRRRS